MSASRIRGFPVSYKQSKPTVLLDRCIRRNGLAASDLANSADVGLIGLSAEWPLEVVSGRTGQTGPRAFGGYGGVCSNQWVIASWRHFWRPDS